MDHTAPLTVFSFGAAFLTGLLGAGHCLGMCGSLVSAFFMRVGARGPWPSLAYHAARLVVYGAIGFLAAVAGGVLVGTGRLGLTQALLQILAGAFVIVLGLDLLGLSPIRNRLGFAPLAWLRQRFLAAAAKGSLTGAALGGALNGLMPCSMTMAMAVQATTAPSAFAGAALLLAFGAGTLPTMLSASILFGKLGPRLRGALLKAAAITIIALGLATLWQGTRYFLVMYPLIL